ncbi:MAG: hypothetical protein ABFC18_03380 [Rikenellaceae bacterium]
MIITSATSDYPEIQWELGSVLETDIEERMVVREAAGCDKEGNNYSASAYFYAGEFEQMEGVEKL